MPEQVAPLEGQIAIPLPVNEEVQQKKGQLSVGGHIVHIGKVIGAVLLDLVKRIRALVLEIVALTILGATSLVSLRRVCDPKDPKDPNIDPDKPVILLIHGFLGRSNHWIYHRHSLVDKGVRNVFTVDLGSPFLSVEEYAAVVDQRVKEIHDLLNKKRKSSGKEEDKEIDVILGCHSMGGLVADAYKKIYTEKPEIRVAKAEELVPKTPKVEKPRVNIIDTITIGTPLAGTPVAYLAALFSKAARQMLPSSGFSRLRKMKGTRSYVDKVGNKIFENININADGIKKVERTKILGANDKRIDPKATPNNRVKKIQTTVIEEKFKGDSSKKLVTKRRDIFLESGAMRLTETKKVVQVKTHRTLHIGSTYDLIVPCASAIDLETDRREKVEGKAERKGMGGHGWQLFSREVHETVLNRINADIKEREQEKTGRPVEVDLSLEEPQD